ncbi:hypothetical protein [uncultured Helicobacter sp.]
MLAQTAFLTRLTPRIHRISHLDSVYARVSGASGDSLLVSDTQVCHANLR